MGIFSTVKAYAKKTYSSRKTEAKQSIYAKERIRKKSKAEYWRAKEVEEKKLARQMARHEREQAYKKKTAPKQSFFSMGTTAQPQTRTVTTRKKGKKGKQTVRTTQVRESAPSLVSAPKERSMLDTPSFEKLTKDRRF